MVLCEGAARTVLLLPDVDSMSLLTLSLVTDSPSKGKYRDSYINKFAMDKVSYLSMRFFLPWLINPQRNFFILI